MLTLVDRFLNKITMYRLLFYYLCGLLGLAIIFGAIGWLPYSPLNLIFTAVVLLAACWATNTLFAWAFGAQTNVESVYITALILALVIAPVAPAQTAGVVYLIWTSVFAMASKYIVAIRKKHLFNPAAFGLVITYFTLNQSATWWVGGNIPLMPFVIIGGLLVVRKIQRFDLVLSYLAAAAVTVVATVPSYSTPLAALEKAALHTPIFFFAFVMITEPLTTPPTRSLRILYGILTGFLYAPAIHLAGIYSTPELALVVANIFSYVVSPKGKHVLTLKEKREVGAGLYDFVFQLDHALKFKPGQYLEWTLGHGNPDSRGNRRYFTIASSPTEFDLHMGVRFYPEPSTFKQRLNELKPGDGIVAGQLAGDFVLPKDPAEKIVFIAGGIGITPFRSMVKYLSDTNEKRSVALLYSNREQNEIAYKEIFDEGTQKFGLKTIYTLTNTERIPAGWQGERGYISADMIKRTIPDYQERTFYISGSHAMVVAAEAVLKELGIPLDQIKVDFFPGFA